MRGWRGSAGMKGLEGRWSLRGGCRGSERARRRQRARECRGAGRAGVANGIQMVGAGVPGAEVRAAHHTQSPPPPRGTPPRSVTSLRAGPARPERCCLAGEK